MVFVGLLNILVLGYTPTPIPTTWAPILWGPTVPEASTESVLCLGWLEPFLLAGSENKQAHHDEVWLQRVFVLYLLSSMSQARLFLLVESCPRLLASASSAEICGGRTLCRTTTRGHRCLRLRAYLWSKQE